MQKNDYVFPFDTCEKPDENGMIAQPWSVFVNSISILITIYFLTKTKHSYSLALVFSILSFQLFHLFSHIVHVEGKIQIYLVHSFALLANLLYINALYQYTKKFPETWYLIYVTALLVFDMYALFNLTIIYYFFTQMLLLVSTLLYYNNMMPTYYQNLLPYIIGSITLLFCLFFNEYVNCKYMLSKYPNFPFHVLIELTGIAPLYLILSVFSKL